MKHRRDYILRQWNLAEDMAVQSSKPLHAFLLLHNLLTQPPSVLRRASGTTLEKDRIVNGDVTSTSTQRPEGTTPKVALPLHVASFDAEWKCEELVTRLRAAEYLLFTDAPAARPGGSPTSVLPSPRPLSCSASLEALELAEQVLAPIFATTSILVSTDNIIGTMPPQQVSTTAPSRHSASCASNRFSRVGNKKEITHSRSSYLDDVVREVMDVNQNCTGTPARSSSASLAAEAGGVSVSVQSRVASMYFLNQATVTALAWPLSGFTLAWPVADALADGSDETHAATEDGVQPHLSTSLVFGPANDTITIALSLVVRAHVLQALICHRRSQHKRALQCLAEAHQWIAQQFNDAARTRAVRLLWEDLQERWMPHIRQQQKRASSTSTSPAVATAGAIIQLPPLPGFHRLIGRVIAEEGRACAAMVQTEECKIYYAILQSCSSLPPPALLPCRSASSATAPPFVDAGAQMPAHTADLRLHSRRHQEGLQLLHLLSRGYMTLVRWIEEEAQGDARRTTSSDTPFPSGKSNTMVQSLPWRDALRSVRSRLSPFCLCALQRAYESPPDPPIATTTTTTEPSNVSQGYALGFDMRLAAEILGLYHCLSYVYLLYQKSPAAAQHVVSTMQPDSRSVVDLMARITDRGSVCDTERWHKGNKVAEGGREEEEFLRRYRSVLACETFFGDQQTRPLAQQTSSLVDTDIACRAVEHAKINAFIFGKWHTDDAAVASTSSSPVLCRADIKKEMQIKTESVEADEHGGTALQRTVAQAERPPTWRVATETADSTAPSTTHEISLLWCLVELSLRDNYPFAIRFQRESTDATSPLAAPAKIPHAAQAPGQGLTEAPAAQAPFSGNSSADEMKSSNFPEKRTSPDDACWSMTRKRSRSSSPPLQQTTKFASSFLQPPPSWNWIDPGVRHVFRLYLDLVTVAMRTAATAQVSASNSSSEAEVLQSAVTISPAAASMPLPRLALRHAEQLMARLLFRVDAEMVRLAGNTWGMSPAASAREGGSARAANVVDRQDGKGTKVMSSDPSRAQLSRHLLADQLQCSAPTQLRALVQIKAAALVTMARHHLTQLSLVRAAHYLREGQQFSQVFHRQAKLTLLPEMHILLACIATCMSMRRLPELAEPAARKDTGSEGRGRSVSSGDGDAATDGTSGTPHDALFSFAQGWLSTGRAEASAHELNSNAEVSRQLLSLGGSQNSQVIGNEDFSILPQEESTVAQDVGLPYLHLLAAERASCTSLHTPPSLSLLLYIMKAWTVLHLVTAGEELLWQEGDGNSASPLSTPMHTSQQQRSTGKASESPSLSTAALRSRGLASVSPSPPLLPLPSPSHATTTLNTTLEDQQRRVARLDSLTTTPSSTPTLRSRHATVPMEMHRIQLEPPIAAAHTTAEVGRDGKDEDGDTGVGHPPKDEGCIKIKAVSDANMNGNLAHSPQNHSNLVKQVPIKTDDGGIGDAHTQRNPRYFHGASSMTATAPYPSGACVKMVPQTQRHRARDVLQRMISVLLHHYETHTVDTACMTPTASSGNSGTDARAPQRASLAAWTPQNIVLFRLLHGAHLLLVDRDELAAARIIKEATHYAKGNLGVLHPYVADGLALLANVYASLDVDAVTSGDGHTHCKSPGAAASMSPEGALDNAARTRRVAVQLAMRCSCTALASLHINSAASATAAATEHPHQETSLCFSTAARLQEWWSNQVLHELCGNNIGGYSRSGGYDRNAVRRLRLLFSWLPGSVDYPSS